MGHLRGHEKVMHNRTDSRDHYVAQTYLKHFSCYKNHVSVYQKHNGNTIQHSHEHTNKICWKTGWDVCYKYKNHFVLRKLLTNIEPAWNEFIQSVKEKTLNKINPKIFPAGVLYIAYLRALSPRSIKLVKNLTEDKYNHRLQHDFDKIEGLSSECRQLIRDGLINIEINDTDYFKLRSMEQLEPLAKTMHSNHWDILINNTSTKLITSDNPVIFKNFYTRKGRIHKLDGQPMPLYLPLTPKFGLVIRNESSDKISYKEVMEEEVNALNKEMIKSASNLIISSNYEINNVIANLVHQYANTSLDVVINNIQINKNFAIKTVQQKPIHRKS